MHLHYIHSKLNGLRLETDFYNMNTHRTESITRVSSRETVTRKAASIRSASDGITGSGRVVVHCHMPHAALDQHFQIGMRRQPTVCYSPQVAGVALAQYCNRQIPARYIVELCIHIAPGNSTQNRYWS